MNENKLAFRLKIEIEKILGGPTKVAAFLKVARNTVYNWMEKGNIPADKLEKLEELGLDGGYVLFGQRTTSFENKLAGLKAVTNMITTIADSHPSHPDPMQLGPLRDLAFESNLNEQHIATILDLIDKSSDIFSLEKKSPIDMDMIESGLIVALKCIEVGDAQDLNMKNKTEFIMYVIKDIIEKHSIETPAIQNSTESNVMNFMEHLKKQQANGG